MNFNKIKLAKNESLCYTAVTTLQDGENKNPRAQGCAAEMGCKAMIKLRNVHKTFGHLEVLKGIDLAVAKGEKLVIIGPVSYTHLDVYKRQRCRRLQRAVLR